MLISLIMQIAQIMQNSIRHFLTPQTMHITFPLKNLAVKNISGLTHCRYSSGKWTILDRRPFARKQRNLHCDVGETGASCYNFHTKSIFHTNMQARDILLT